MEMLLYLALAAVLYGIIADRADRAVERVMRRRRVGSHLRPVGDGHSDRDAA